ncbi:unnamed protein product [Amoebophrya sp. A25]|nr:unnamed protein product [Amoebophrya sp. A25]|eukprot:GSA25T00020986001.1
MMLTSTPPMSPIRKTRDERFRSIFGSAGEPGAPMKLPRTKESWCPFPSEETRDYQLTVSGHFAGGNKYSSASMGSEPGSITSSFLVNVDEGSYAFVEKNKAAASELGGRSSSSFSSSSGRGHRGSTHRRNEEQAFQPSPVVLDVKFSAMIKSSLDEDVEIRTPRKIQKVRESMRGSVGSTTVGSPFDDSASGRFSASTSRSDMKRTLRERTRSGERVRGGVQQGGTVQQGGRNSAPGGGVQG